MHLSGIAKTAILLCCICISIARNVQPDSRVSPRLAQIFSIPLEEAEKCVNKTHVVLEDMRALEQWFGERRIGDFDQESLDRAACTSTCAAQAQGTMIGPKINLKKIDELLRTSFTEPAELERYRRTARLCNENVKDMTNECIAGREFLYCFVEEYRKD